MKRFEIFKAGTQTSSNGVTLDFGEDLLRQAVEAYDPALHEAPIVIGHPKDNGPAWGWIKSLDYADGVMQAEPHQVDADFAELVEKGRYKKRSASFYLPDSPSNPKPGTLYLRHVGFLGAMPPAVKGLKGVEFEEAIQEKGLRSVSFKDAEEGVVEFEEGSSSAYIWSLLASLFRSRREAIIADKGVEAADKEVPSYYIDELNSEAERKRRAVQSQVEDGLKASPSFAEPSKQPNEDTGMTLTPEQIAALQAENASLKAQQQQAADFAEAEKKLADRERALAKREIEGDLDKLIAEGKVLPAQKAGLAEFMASLDDAEQVVEFGEGDAAQKVSPRQFMRDYLASMPKLVDFKERAKDEKKGDEFDEKTALKKISDEVIGGGAA